MSYLGVRCALAVKMPNCEGYMRAISVKAPKGSIVNPNEPAACGARGIICFRMFDTILGAFSKILPDRILLQMKVDLLHHIFQVEIRIINLFWHLVD